LVDVVVEDPRWESAGLGRLADRAARAVLDRLGLDPAGFGVAVLGCDDARIAALNRDFRDRPQPTNVLSWPSQERGAGVPGERPVLPEPGELGDIAIAWEICAREAAAANRRFGDHVSHLLVHGLLHLLGYDHIDDQDAALMQVLEIEILVSLGIENPY